MAEYKVELLLISLVMFWTSSAVDGLSCYNCSSLGDSRCGREFQYSDSEASSVVSECTGNTSACRKIETTDNHGEFLIVFRSCWSFNTSDGQPALECQDVGADDQVCYCWGHLCNGQMSRHADVIALIKHVFVIATTVFIFAL